MGLMVSWLALSFVACRVRTYFVALHRSLFFLQQLKALPGSRHLALLQLQSEDDDDESGVVLFRPLPKEERAAVFTRDVIEAGIMTRSELNEANKVS
jgi:hypothetical protein